MELGQLSFLSKHYNCRFKSLLWTEVRSTNKVTEWMELTKKQEYGITKPYKTKKYLETFGFFECNCGSKGNI